MISIFHYMLMHGVDQMAYLETPRLSLAAPSDFSAIIARMKYPYRGVAILLTMFVVGVTCLGQVASAQAAALSDDAPALVKQGKKLNSEGKRDEALTLYKQALEKSPTSYEAHLESGVALDLKGDYAAARAPQESDRGGSGGFRRICRKCRSLTLPVSPPPTHQNSGVPLSAIA